MRALIQNQNQPDAQNSPDHARPHNTAASEPEREAKPVAQSRQGGGAQAAQHSPAAPQSPEDNSGRSPSAGFAHDFSRVPVYAEPPVLIQKKLAVDASADSSEHEADSLAEQVLRMPEPQGAACGCNGGCPRCRMEQTGQARERLQFRRAGTANLTQTNVPPIVHEVLRAPGRPLDSSARTFMESRFGQDFSHVRVHTDARAALSAQAVKAYAYTVGSDVVFGAGRYAPASRDGQRLLAHELAHVVQQGASTPRMQLKPDPKDDAQPKGARFKYRVVIDRVLDGDQLLLQFIKQYFGVQTDADADAMRVARDLKWVGGVAPTVTQADADKGYIYITVLDNNITPATEAEKKERGEYFEGLAPDEQSAINAETDEQFWKKTNTPRGTYLGKSAEDKQLAEDWKVLRNELIRQHQAIAALPPDIQKFIFDEHAPALEPKDFEQLLRIASKIIDLTPAELAEYKSRVTAKTADWDVYEASIDRFLTERAERNATAEEKRTIETRLFGLDALYDRYRSYLSMLKNNARLSGMGGNNPAALGTALGTQPTLNKMRSELEADLVTAGFPGGLADFEKFIKDYEKVFERETLAIANVMLDQYAHLLWTEEERYRQDPTLLDSLHQAVGQTTARADYEEAEKIRDDHATIPMTLDEVADQAYWLGQRDKALKRGEANVSAAAAAHPLVNHPDFDRERLARASSSEVKTQMFDYIAARQKDIAETRTNLKDKPTMIYGLDTLLEASFKEQNIQPGSIYDKIIRNHISDVHWAEAIPKLILGVIAVAAGLLSGGTGTVAVLAGATALGIGAYQAIEEFRRYEMQSAAHGAKLTSDDPSMAWVIIAVVGAGLDAGALVAALRTVPKLRVAIEAFNSGAEADDVAKLAEKVNQLTDVEEGIRKSIIQAADAEVKARAAWKGIFRVSHNTLYAVPFPYALEFGRFVYAVYLSARRGIREFQVFVKSREAVDLIGDVAKLSPEDLAALKTSYLAAVRELETVAAHGKTLKMADDEIEAFMKLRANTPGMTVDQVVTKMDEWKTTQAISWKGFSAGKLKTHHVKHGPEFPGLSQAQYLAAAKGYASEIGSFRVQQVGNFLVKYDDATRRTLIAHIKDREIRTFYIADTRDADPFQAAIDLARELSGK